MIYLIWLISKGLLKRPSELGRWRLFVFGGRGLAEMPGKWRFEAFVSGWFFWSYFALGELRKRVMTLARSLDIGAGVLIPVIRYRTNQRCLTLYCHRYLMGLWLNVRRDIILKV